MTTLLMILVGLSMLGTLGVMFAGMLGLVRSDPAAGDRAGAMRSNRLMRWRVILQGTTLVLFLVLLVVMRG